MTDVGAPATDDDERWKQEADDLRHTGLAAMRESAGKWLETIGIILGVFSVVAFVKGPESLTDLDEPIAYLLIAFVLGAALTAATATWLAALAAHGSPRLIAVLTGPKLREHVEGSFARVARQLWWSRLLTVVAALFIAVGIAVAWSTSVAAESGKTAKVLIVDDDGTVACGPVSNGAVMAGDDIRAALGRPSTVQIVDKCP